MTKEEKYVVNPLVNHFRRSRAKWRIIHKPKYGAGATGWDLQVGRKNLVLLFEAKHIKGSFAASIAGLTLAPLVRHHKELKRHHFICWAIGCAYRGGKDMHYIFQLLFDYFARNLQFWKCYSRTLKVASIFFVDNGKVASISFPKILNLAKQYKKNLRSGTKARRESASKLMANVSKQFNKKVAPF